MRNYRYPVKFMSNDEGGFIGTFRDIPEALTEVWPEENFIEVATDALVTAIDFYLEGNRKLPEPSEPLEDEVLVEVPASVMIKILLLNSMLEANLRPADLARKMKKRPQEVTRILDLKHNTKIDTLVLAFGAMGKTLAFSVE